MNKKISIILVLPLLASLSNCKSSNSTSKIDAYFNIKIGNEVQNIKKINMFSPTWEFCGTGPGMVNDNALETLSYLDDLQSEQFRIDLMMGNGGIGSLIGKNSNGTTAHEFDSVMKIANKLQNNKTTPMFVMCDIPEYAQTNNNSKIRPNMENYYEICYNIASYLKNNGIKNVTYETWNEPDLGTTFWGGSMSDIIDTSITQTKAIKDADPYATISSLGLCWPLEFINKKKTEEDGTMTSWKRFWSKSLNENAMPDALSWHYYGQVGGKMEDNDDITTDFSYWLYNIREAFNSTQNGSNKEIDYPLDLSKVQQLVTEYHAASSLDSLSDTTSNISKMYDSIHYALDATDITKVYWACYLSEYFGVIDKYSYLKNPGFNVLYSYARLPLNVVKVDNSDNDIGIFSGVDKSRAGLIIYNKANENKDVLVNLNDILFKANDITVYQIDSTNLAYATDIDYPYIKYKKENITNKDLKNIRLNLNGNMAYYIEVNDNTNQSEIEKERSIGTILKKEYYYKDRGSKYPYSDLHNNSLTATLSMANNLTGESAISTIIDVDENVNKLSLIYEGFGNFIKTNTSSLGVKIDYLTNDGYKNSTYYTVANNNYNFALPFGNRSVAEKTVNMGDDVNGSYIIKLKENAPSDWNGIITMTYIIKDVGIGSTLNITMDKE